MSEPWHVIEEVVTPLSESPTVAPTETEIERVTGRRHMNTQSQTTYRRELSQPRFQPLGESAHGAWERN